MKMRESPAGSSRRRLLLALPSLAALGVRPAAWALPAEATAAVLQARLDQQGVGLVAAQVEGVPIAITARGSADANEPIRDDALFEIGSLTKTFTALLLADAVQRRRMSLGDAVEDALPGVRLRDVDGRPIRWVDLATHRSGLPRLPANMTPKDPADPYADYSAERLLDFLRGFKASIARDTRWEYSNLGFGLLGYALAQEAKTPYADLLAGRVLRPLGLDAAFLAAPGRRIAGLVEGHDPSRAVAPHWHFDVMMPAGGLVMGAAGLARYAQAALGIVDSPLREAFDMTQREHAAGPVERNPVGLAWIRAPLNGRWVLNHDGGTAGFSTSLWLDPTRQRASLVLANAMVEVNDLALHLLDDSVPVKDLSSTRQPEIAVAADQLAPLAAVYALSPQFKLTVSVRDGALWAQATGQGSFQLFATAPRRFFARITPLDIEFDAATPPAALTLHQGGQTLRFVRE
jgi:CubicO group peptidase (beta-lactamase class C family)